MGESGERIQHGQDVVHIHRAVAAAWEDVRLRA